MTTITVTAKTEQGRKAIEKHLAETALLPSKVRKEIRKRGILQEIIELNPMTIRITQPEVLQGKYLLPVFTDAMNSNGATSDDYVLSVEDK